MDQEITFTQNMDALFANLEDFTKKESVFGQPATYGEKTLIPLMSVTLGYGSGNTAMKSQQNTTTSSPGGGVGLGAKICTDGVVVIDKDNVFLLPISNVSNLGQMVDKIPQILMNMNQGKQQGAQSNQQGTQPQQ